MCHEISYIDFSLFNSALIVGKIGNNDSYSNGVGKTSIFKAIELGLFNQSDVILEKVIRDDTDFCKITIDFFLDDQEYRLSRQRTKKGNSDLTLLQRTATVGTDEEVYHSLVSDDIYQALKDNDQKFWKDISCRRTADTEKELEKLLKINFKSFRGTVHFLQNDFSGLASSTPEKRKSILKDALNIIVYSKLEKIAKEKAGALVKNIDRHKSFIEALGDLDQPVVLLKNNLCELEKSLLKENDKLKIKSRDLLETNNYINTLVSSHRELEAKYSFLLDKEKQLLFDKDKKELSAKEYSDKKNQSVSLAKEIINEVSNLKETINKLSNLDFYKIDVLSLQISEAQQQLLHYNVIIQNNISEYEELKIPVPNDNICKHCRQGLTEDHKKNCKLQIKKDIDKCQNNIKLSKQEVLILKDKISSLRSEVNVLINAKLQLEDVRSKILSKNKEIQDKKDLCNDYSSLLDKINNEIKERQDDLLLIKEEIQKSSLIEAEKIKITIEDHKNKSIDLNKEISVLSKEIAHLNASKAVTLHSIEQNDKDKVKLAELKNKLEELENEFVMYPYVLQAFSSTGIPNLIIQNVLDDLQNKSNELLLRLRPGLQLSFLIEKTKSDGTDGETLDICYYVNGKERYYEQLSGAMKVAIVFSLKLGLSSLLQEIYGSDIRFLLLDEIDQSLDKASVDAFADIVKFFQKDFTILVITHNDRLKDRFQNAILVRQDLDMVSRAKVVNSW